MAGCSTFTNGSSLDFVEPVGAYQGDGCCLDFDRAVKNLVDDVSDYKVKQKCLFYQLLSVHLKENNSRGIIRPVPVMLGDGQSLDLYNLFFFVKERGGYALVTKKGLWGSVAKELGLNLEVLASVKLVYGKYLNEFEGWLRKTYGGKNFRNGNHGCNFGIKSLPLEIEREFRGLLCPNLNWKDEGPVQLESNKIRKYIDVVNHNSEMNLLDNKNQHAVHEDVQNIHGGDVFKLCNGLEDDLATLNSEVTEKEFNSRKRKREASSAMLKWIRQIAKHPLDPSIEPIPEPSEWKEYKGKDFWFQILRAREAFLRCCVEPNSGKSSSQKLKMHPAMYEDHVALSHRSTVKLRCTERFTTSVKSRLCSCCNSCSAIEDKLTSSVNTEAENASLEEKTAADDLLTAKVMANPSGDDTPEKHVSIGPRFQAEVPKWTGVVSESVSKWLGTQVWPLKYSETKPATATDLTGKGRQEKCSCQVQGSVECVRFHIAEKRMKLKLELGSAFYQWGFDCMGEEVSLQWTTEEEKKFKNIMMSNLPSQTRCLLNNPSKYFPKKTRRNLVSYYFNVFLIQRRVYQNRVTPDSVDSDDDELEFGSLSDGFGMETVKGPGNKFPECSQNNQCTDLE